jgi:hypothetical protein
MKQKIDFPLFEGNWDIIDVAVADERKGPSN